MSQLLPVHRVVKLRAAEKALDVAGTATLVAVFAGALRTGAGGPGGGGGVAAVVKLRVVENALVPPALVAFTRQ